MAAAAAVPGTPIDTAPGAAPRFTLAEVCFDEILVEGGTRYLDLFKAGVKN